MKLLYFAIICILPGYFAIDQTNQDRLEIETKVFDFKIKNEQQIRNNQTKFITLPTNWVKE